MDTENYGCSLEIIFIAVLLFIAYLVLNDKGDKTGYVALVLIAYFIYRMLKNIKIEGLVLWIAIIPFLLD